MRLDHATLRMGDLPGLRRFFEEIFDLKDGFRPTFGFPGHWLYDGDEPLVHLIPTRPGSDAPVGVSEGIHHIAFCATTTTRSGTGSTPTASPTAA